MFLPLTLLLGLVLGACTNSDRATETLQKAGFTEVKITGFGGAFACGEGDWSKTAFEATNPNDQRITGVVCCGATKRCTIRY
jgi:2-methylisocitrate lyase-like PEP mutase family enzyme